MSPRTNIGRVRTSRSGRRADGMTLVEIVAALGLFCVLVLSVAFTLVKGIEHRRQSFQVYQGISALRNLVAEIQESANLPTDLAAKTGIGAIYTKYNGKSFPVSSLQAGQISVTCFPNETTVPAILGGPQDLNVEGDAQDDLGNQSAGVDLKIVPMTLTLTYIERGATLTRAMHLLVTRTSD